MPVLRGCHEGEDFILNFGNFPLVPFVNRVRDGRFTFRGREIRLAPNLPGDPSPLHGQGWLSPWVIAEASGSVARLQFDHQAGEWPWDYSAEQVIRLDAGGVTLELSCRNTSGEPMPCGLGHHPYFWCTSETRIDTEVETVWTIDENTLPVEQVPATGRYDLRNRAICGQELDHGFGGWGGTVRMWDPSWPFDLELSSASARFFQIYSPADGGFFVAEPVTHANAALNEPEEKWAELGLRVLEPGEEMQLEARLDIRAK